MVDLQFHHKKHNTCSQGKKSKKDRLSELADDTILHILSSLTMKEAGRTNVLSTRWRYLWSNIQDLTFYPPQRTKEIHKTTSYMNWVDQVTRSHSMMSSVDDFWVQCHLQAKDVEKVNRWVKFASMKGVKWLEMDIVLLSGSQLLHYTFPRFNFVSLSSLKLSRVNVTGEDLEMIFSDCFHLELVSIENSDSLVELKIAGQSLQLKYLGLFYCNKIKKLEISAPNLVQVTYYGPEIMVPFKSNPKLVKMVLGGKFVIALTNTFQKHSSYLSQLEKLEIVLECTEDSAMKSVNFPKLERLKALSVHIISPLTCLDLLYMKPLIDACPSLYKFTLTMNNDTDNRERIMRTEWTGSIHKHLKIVKIVELCGAAGVEFAVIEFMNWLLE